MRGDVLLRSHAGAAGSGRSLEWPAYVFGVATAVYVVALVLNAASGMPMPPVPATRVIASLSVLVGAPALLWFVMGMTVRRSSKNRLAIRLAVGATLVFATVAILNRILQLSIAAQLLGPRFDLYVAPSPANFAEMFAWDFCLGVAGLALARLLTLPAERWPRRMFVAAGLFLLAGELLYLVSTQQVGGIAVALAGVGVSIAAWVVLFPGAVVWTAVASRSYLSGPEIAGASDESLRQGTPRVIR